MTVLYLSYTINSNINLLLMENSMNKKPHIAVVLSGCGRADGSEIHESVCALLSLENMGCTYQCFAPDI